MAAKATRERKEQAFGSVQEDFVRLREIYDNVMCLASAGSSTGREYATPIRVTGINLGLSDIAERTAVTAKYRALLNGLTHPLQILIRTLPLNLDRFLAHLSGGSSAAVPRIWTELADSQRNMILERAADRMLMDRSFYIIIPANLDKDLPGGFAGLTQTTFFPWGRKRREHQVQEAGLEQATLLLANRAREIMRQLSKMGLHTQRLGEKEIAELYTSCLMPFHAMAAPLPDAVLSGIGQPFQRKGATWGTRSMDARVLEGLELAAQQAWEGESQASGKRGRHAPVPFVQSTFSQLVDRLAPASIKIDESMISLGHVTREFASTIIIDGLPAELPDNIMAPLLEINEVMDITFHYTPLSRLHSINKLKADRTEQVAQRLYAERHGKLVDAETEVKQDKTIGLMRQLVSGEESPIAQAMYVLARADSRRALDERSRRIMDVLRSMQMVPRPALFLQDDGYRCFLPEACDPLAQWGTTAQFTGDCGAAFFSFMSNSLFMPDGILMGFTPTNEPVAINRWDTSHPNPHIALIGPTGEGKSTVNKDLTLRTYLRRRTNPCKTIIIDPEGEYVPIVDELKGQWIQLAPGSGHRINPLDLGAKAGHRSHRARFDRQEDKLALKIGSLRAVMQIMLCNRDASGVIVPLKAEVMGVLDRSLHALYRQFAITSDPATHTRPMPLLRDFYEVLKSEVGEADPSGLCDRLYPYVHGSHRALFDGPTNVNLDDDLVVFDTFDLGKDLAPTMLAVISDYVWNATFESEITREFIIDEAGILGEYEAWAQFMVELTSRARKHGMAITLIMQDVDMLRNKRVRTMLNNCAIKVLMGSATPGMREVEALSESEVEEMRAFGIGDALLITPQKHIVFQHTVSEVEYRLTTTRHTERAQFRHEQDEVAARPEGPVTGEHEQLLPLQAATQGSTGKQEQNGYGLESEAGRGRRSARRGGGNGQGV